MSVRFGLSVVVDHIAANPFTALTRGIGLVALVFLARLLYRTYIWNYWLTPLNQIPGPPPKYLFPPLGSFPEIMAEEACSPHYRWMRQYAEDLGIVKYHTLFLTPRVMITNPDLVRYILSAHSYQFPKEPVNGDDPFDHSHYQCPLKSIFGSGLLFSEGDVHKRQRRLLNPAFSYRNVREMLPSFWKHSWTLAQKLGLEIAITLQSTSLKEGQPTDNGHTIANNDGYTTLDIHEALGIAALDMIGTVGFGYEFNGLDGEVKHLRNRLRRLGLGEGAEGASDSSTSASALSHNYNKLMSAFGLSAIGVLFFVMPFLSYLYKPESRRKADEALLEINKSVGELIQIKKEARKKVATGDAGKVGKDLITLLMDEAESEGTSLTDVELRDQILTFLTAGHETTALAVSWTLWLLAHNPDIQKKLYSELSTSPHLSHLRTAAASSIADPFSSAYPDAISPENLDSLHYLNMVLKETLRLIPPAPMISTRIVPEEMTISVSNRSFVLPKGTPLVFAPLMNHKLPNYWKKTNSNGEEEPSDDLEEFNPDRWNAMKDSGDEGSGMSAVWLPFSMGPRGCIGQKLAMLEAKVLIAIIVSRFEIDAVPEYTVKKKLRVTWRPDRPLLVRLRERFAH
ncbi:hypothetical protein HDU93_000137 [Gonapodya sp. JEL0774]|nr:hypothetical protein HDU93_000137 [Gonapodya sp. JEL0774]